MSGIGVDGGSISSGAGVADGAGVGNFASGGGGGGSGGGSGGAGRGRGRKRRADAPSGAGGMAAPAAAASQAQLPPPAVNPIATVQPQEIAVMVMDYLKDSGFTNAHRAFCEDAREYLDKIDAVRCNNEVTALTLMRTL